MSSGDKPLSIISIAVAYPSKMENPPKSEPGARRGILARASWGRDYHHVLREALSKLEEFIHERVPEAVLESMVDTGVLVDRAVAERAGIGFSGKNCSIISPKWGSWIYLGKWLRTFLLLRMNLLKKAAGSVPSVLMLVRPEHWWVRVSLTHRLVFLFDAN